MASERRTDDPDAVSAFRAPGSVRANESITPIASSVEIIADPPAETSGSGTPITGSIPMTTPTLTRA